MRVGRIDGHQHCRRDVLVTDRHRCLPRGIGCDRLDTRRRAALRAQLCDNRIELRLGDRLPEYGREKVTVIAAAVEQRDELVEPRYEGADDRNQPFSVTAARAVQSAQDPDLVLLELPQAQALASGGTQLGVTAKAGHDQQKSQKLLLTGDVVLTQDADYEFHTEKLLVFLKDRQAISDQPVSGKGPQGTLHASGMQAEGGKNLLIFTGPVKLVLNGSLKGL